MLKKLKLNSSTRPFRTNTPKRCPFHYRGLECKSRKSRHTWVRGKFGLGIWDEAGQSLIEFCQENALVIANTLFQQHKRRLYTWTSPDGQHRNQIDYILCSQRWRSSISSVSSVAQLCPTLCDPMNQARQASLPITNSRSSLRLRCIESVMHAIQPSHPLMSPSPPAPNPSQHQSLFQ